MLPVIGNKSKDHFCVYHKYEEASNEVKVDNEFFRNVPDFKSMEECKKKFYHILTRIEISRQISVATPHVKLTKIIAGVPCSCSDGRTDMIKMTVAFRNFSNAPKTIFPYQKLLENRK